VQASPLARMLAEPAGAETDQAGRVAVNADCTLPGHAEVFAIGDMVSLGGLPGVAQPAMQEGEYVGKVIMAGSPATRRSSPSTTSTRAAWRPSATTRPSPTRSA
jgi:NADH dehydrogenase